MTLTTAVILCSLVTGFPTAGTLSLFDLPDAGTAANLGPFPLAINDLGQVVCLGLSAAECPVTK